MLRGIELTDTNYPWGLTIQHPSSFTDKVNYEEIVWRLTNTDNVKSRTYVLLEPRKPNDIYRSLSKLSKIVLFLFSDNSAVAPPDPFPNSEVKRSCADGSVGVPMWE